MLPMFLKSEPGKVYDTIFFFIEYFNKCEINNEFIKKYDNSDFMLECYQKVEKRTGVVPELLHPFFFTNDKRVSPISVFFSNHYDFEYDDIDSFILRQHRIIADEDRRRTVAEQKSHSTSAYPL